MNTVFFFFLGLSTLAASAILLAVGYEGLGLSLNTYAFIFFFIGWVRYLFGLISR